jgi:protein TonB
MALRSLAWLLSFGLHAGLLAIYLFEPGGAAFEVGTGDDQFIVEQGISVEGLSQWGQDATTVEAVEAEPLEASQAREAIEKVEAVEEVEETQVIASETGPEQDVPEIKPEPMVEPVPEQVATLEQAEQIAVEEQRAAGAAQTGGSATAQSAYLGKLRSHLEKRKVNPRSRAVGTAVIRFTVDPNGQLLTREVASSSGNKILDDAALASVERAAPFPAMPSDIAGEPLVVSVPFRFTVR